MPDKEVEYVTGTVGAVTQKAADRWSIAVTPAGSQYAKNLHTKSESTKDLATTMLGQTATFECGVSTWDREGQQMRSLWINAVNPGTPPPTNPQPTTQSGYVDPTRESIERQTSLKAAVEHHAGNVTPGQVIETAALFAAFLKGGARASETPADDYEPDIPF